MTGSRRTRSPRSSRRPTATTAQHQSSSSSRLPSGTRAWWEYQPRAGVHSNQLNHKQWRSYGENMLLIGVEIGSPWWVVASINSIFISVQKCDTMSQKLRPQLIHWILNQTKQSRIAIDHKHTTSSSFPITPSSMLLWCVVVVQPSMVGMCNDSLNLKLMMTLRLILHGGSCGWQPWTGRCQATWRGSIASTTPATER